MCLQYTSFDNTVGKGAIACNEQFLLFPVFSTYFENFLPFSSNLKLKQHSLFPTMFCTLLNSQIIILVTFELSCANALNLVYSKNLSFGKELKGVTIFQTSFRLSKRKGFADDNFKFDQNGKEL